MCIHYANEEAPPNTVLIGVLSLLGLGKKMSDSQNLMVDCFVPEKPYFKQWMQNTYMEKTKAAFGRFVKKRHF